MKSRSACAVLSRFSASWRRRVEYRTKLHAFLAPEFSCGYAFLLIHSRNELVTHRRPPENKRIL